jgi:hypothetical protein
MPISTTLPTSKLLTFLRRRHQRQLRKLRKSKKRPPSINLKEQLGAMKMRLILIWEMIQQLLQIKWRLLSSLIVTYSSHQVKELIQLPKLLSKTHKM